MTSYFCRGCEIWTKSGVLMQNMMPITAMWMKSKPQGADYGNNVMVKIRTGSNNSNMADDCFSNSILIRTVIILFYELIFNVFFCR